MDPSEDNLRPARRAGGLPLERKLKHPQVTRVELDIFRLSFSAECMTHACRCRDEGDIQRNDACCQHGADVLIPEKAAILRRAAEVGSVMKEDWRPSSTWFDERSPEEDRDAPGGIILRTGTVDPSDESSGCIFLEHTGTRGCGLHLAALVHGFDPAEIKPMVCRLYPLSFWKRRLGLSPDFDRYSCANQGGPSVYRAMRESVRVALGDALVEELDRIEADVLKRPSGASPRLRIVR